MDPLRTKDPNRPEETVVEDLLGSVRETQMAEETHLAINSQLVQLNRQSG